MCSVCAGSVCAGSGACQVALGSLRQAGHAALVGGTVAAGALAVKLQEKYGKHWHKVMKSLKLKEHPYSKLWKKLTK